MLSIRSSKFICFDKQTQLPIARVEVDVDTAEDLPEATPDGVVVANGYIFAQGSIAWDISTGDFYGLNSEGTWYKQDGSGAYEPDAAVSLSFNAGNLNSPAVQPSQSVQSNFVDDSEGGEEPEVIEDAEPLRNLEDI